MSGYWCYETSRILAVTGAIGVFLFCTAGHSIDNAVQQPNEQPRCAVLLHGLARTHRSMRPVGDYLRENGWQVVNQGYPSRSKPVEELSKMVGVGFARCVQQGVPAHKIDFVTHSMGGLLLRKWVQDTQTEFGRAVMLGPPNNGSELVDRIGATIVFRAYNGPAGSQLGTGANAVWRSLPPVPFELGVIAGVGEERGFLGRHVAAPNDGKVSVASTRVAGMSDHLEVQAGHTFMMNNPEIHRQIGHFLLQGSFADTAATVPEAN